MSCDRCDSCGGEKTYSNQVMLPINGKVRCIDWCIHQIVAALNAGGVVTTACCCGHGKQDGRIDLADGRILFIRDGEEEMTDDKLIEEVQNILFEWRGDIASGMGCNHESIIAKQLLDLIRGSEDKDMAKTYELLRRTKERLEYAEAVKHYSDAEYLKELIAFFEPLTNKGES